MGGWTALLTAYLLGGVTFVPLVILAVLVHAHYTFPQRDDLEPQAAADAHHDDLVQPGDDTTALDAARRDEAKTRPNADLDVSAGFFAVCREYTAMGINAKPIERPTPVGSTTVAPPSPSVYQTMYRSIFDRKAQTGPLDKDSMNQRPRKAGNVFYVVLRHGHLMLFDDDEQIEVRHVISLAHHDISIYSGGDTTPEGELFIKRNALCLSRKTGGPEMGPDSHVSKPFYLFSENCSAKEDFYFALLKSQEQTFSIDNKAPSPKYFEVKNIISLVQKLHSSEDNIHSRWLNAMLGRVFLALYKTRDLENLICDKITKKISRVKRPSFLTNITIQRIDTGEAAPYFTNLKLKDLTVEGECVVEADVKYTGNFRLEVAASAKIDLGTRFKVREVNLVLAVVLKKVEGHVLFKIKPPPSNRVWFSFQTMPKLEMAIEPIVSSRQITYTVILRQIENRIKEVFAETLVHPFWDDIPFFRTEHKKWRGGIFEGDDALEPSEAGQGTAQTGDVDTLDGLEENTESPREPKPLEKSHSLPAIEPQPSPTGLFGRKLGKSGTSLSASGSSTSVDAKGSSGSPRSPKVMANTNAPEPVVGTDTAHADVFKPSSSPPDHATNYMAALHSRSQEEPPTSAPTESPAKPRSVERSSTHSSSSSMKEGSGGNEDSMAAKPTPPARRSTASSAESATHLADADSQSDASSSLKGQTGSLGRNFFLRRENSNASAAAGSVHSDNSQKKNTLAAMTNAAAQARQWGWNALQRQKEARKHGDAAGPVDLTQPMGRGQPLPPPGTPLPRPTNGRTRIAPAAVPKRKPVPEHAAPEHSEADQNEHRLANPPPLPQRRRRGGSYDTEPEGEQNVLVVAAPDDDSQPTTPLNEKAEYVAPFVEEAGEEEAGAEGQAADSVASAPAPTAPVLETVASPPVSAEEPNMEPMDEEQRQQQAKPDDPIVAIPTEATPPAEEEDDDYSGWMENDLDEGAGAPPEAAPTTENKP